jgi:hypothetical protein
MRQTSKFQSRKEADMIPDSITVQKIIQAIFHRDAEFTS